MPYSNIHWIKLKLELLTDKRFIFDCNDEQKLLFIGLIMLAGTTNNAVPNDAAFIKNRLNLSSKPDLVQLNIDFLLSTFRGLLVKGTMLKFRNFNKLHNRIGNSEGTPEELQRVTQNRTEQIRKEQMDLVIKKLLSVKNWDVNNPVLVSDTYRRYGRAAKRLILMAGDEHKAAEAIEYLGKNFDKKGLQWSLEAIVKWYPEFTKKPKCEMNTL